MATRVAARGRRGPGEAEDAMPAFGRPASGPPSSVDGGELSSFAWSKEAGELSAYANPSQEVEQQLVQKWSVPGNCCERNVCTQ